MNPINNSNSTNIKQTPYQTDEKTDKDQRALQEVFDKQVNQDLSSKISPDKSIENIRLQVKEDISKDINFISGKIFAPLGHLWSVPRDSSLENSLDNWLVDTNIKGDKAKAAFRIRTAFYDKSTSLDLKDLKLTKLPPSFGQLNALKDVDLCGNLIKSPIMEIAPLSDLKSLKLQENQSEMIPKEELDLIIHHSVKEWVNNDKIKGNKIEASRRILEAFKNNSANLDLDNLELNQLPSCVCRLINLDKFYVSHNHLTSLPTEIGQLSNLRDLRVGSNNLTSLPSEIGQLSNLRDLRVGSNNLTSLPPETGQLSNIINLNVSHNHLTSLPMEIGQLSNLRDLRVGSNNLTSLPTQIGQLANLTNLNVDENHLTSLPQEIGQLANLEYFHVDANNLTSLPQEIRQLPTFCKLYFYDNRSLYVPPIQVIQLEHLLIYGIPIIQQQQNNTQSLKRFKKWITLSGCSLKVEDFEKLNESEMNTLNDWLRRLGKTADFKREEVQKELAVKVGSILESVLFDKEFKEHFFLQAEINNSNCQDRSAMAFNEIYTAQQINKLGDNAPIQEKLDLIVRAAKTVALRGLIATKINLYEKNKKSKLNEGVEIYLYYETLLKKELNLLTAIDQMSYTQMGKRDDVIDPKKIVDEVNECYLQDLVAMSVFDKISSQSEDLSKSLELIHGKYSNKMEILSEDKPKGSEFSPEVLDWEIQLKKLEVDREKKIKGVKITWFLENYKKETK